MSSLVTSDLSTIDARRSRASDSAVSADGADSHDVLKGEARGKNAKAPQQDLLRFVNWSKLQSMAMRSV